MTGDRKARDPELLELIDKFARTPFAGKVWRVVRETRDPPQASPVCPRWDPGTFDVLYTSLDRDGAMEEMYFHLSRQPVFPSVPFTLDRLRELHLPEIGALEALGSIGSRGDSRDNAALPLRPPSLNTDNGPA